MDKGRPFRVPQPADRRVISKPETHRQPEVGHVPDVPTPAPVAAYPSAAPATSRRETKAPKAKKRPLWLIAVGVVVLAGLGWFAWSTMQNNGTAIDSSKYQAVFFTNGQVYFGKLHSFNGDYLKLTDIYYLQTQTSSGTDSKNPQETSNDQSNVQLIKLGNEVHGPEDQMIIAKDQVLFYENLKPSGKVAQSISKYKAPN